MIVHDQSSLRSWRRVRPAVMIAPGSKHVTPGEAWVVRSIAWATNRVTPSAA